MDLSKNCLILLIVVIFMFQINANEYDTTAHIEDFPYHLGVHIHCSKKPVWSPPLICSGSIISHKYALTAAHCTELPKVYEIDNITVHAGSEHSREHGIVIDIIEVHQHKQFDRSVLPWAYDVSILTFSKSIEFNANVRPVQLPASGMHINVGTKCNVSGWVGLEEPEPPYEFFLNVPIEIVDFNICRLTYSAMSHIYRNRIGDEKLCATVKHNITSGIGNSGPLVTHNVQIGILTSGYAWIATFPSLFINLAHPNIRTWIKSITNV